MATSNVAVDEGTADKRVATYSFSEDAVTKELQRVVINRSDGTAVDPDAASPVYASGREYETVAASQTAQVLGATGAAADVLDGLLIVPATTSPGNVIILDNATSITVFAGGASSVSNLVPFYVPLGLASVSGAWKVTTGANVSVVASGNFT